MLTILKQHYLRTLLIDDEPAATIELRRMLDYHTDIEVVAEATNITDGLLKIDLLKPELLFIDIEMPGGTGFDLVRQLKKGNRPEIVFVTSRDKYALRAFSCAALGYVLKPVEASTLAEAISRAEERIRQKNNELRLEALLTNLNTTNRSEERISIPGKHGMEFVKAGDIMYCQGEERYTRIHLKCQQSRLSSYPIGEYRKMLPAPDFHPTHRSFLVNRRYVDRPTKDGNLLLNNGTIVTVSRRRREEVAKWLNKERQ